MDINIITYDDYVFNDSSQGNYTSDISDLQKESNYLPWVFRLILDILLGMLLGFLCFLTVAGNALVLHAVRKERALQTVVNNGKQVLIGKDMSDVAIITSESNDLSVVVNNNGNIDFIASNDGVKEKYKEEQFSKIIDGNGRIILPGFVDGHTHPVWCGDRVHEFAMKLAGATYMEVHAAGGGINYTVNCVRAASEDELYANFKRYAKKALCSGTTLMECKSGYGLESESEIKMLKVINRGIQDETLPIDISVTYCGAHSVPKGFTSDQATEDVINRQIPAIRKLVDSDKMVVDNIDVFCEKGVFDVEQTRRILEAGTEAGWAINFHGEELNQLNSAEMGARLNARAISHLEEISDEGIDAMAKSGSIAVVLPTTAFILRLRPPPVRKMIDRGVAVALGSDFNPNAHCYTMPIVMNLACIVLHMNMNEALVACTINAAASLGRSHQQGSIENGKFADFVIIEASRWEHIIYQLGSHNDLITHVIKQGNVVYCKDD